MFSLLNKSVVITGGGSGIGRAISKLFASQGASVHILDLNRKGAGDVLAEIDEMGYKAFMYDCDVSNQAQVVQVINRIKKIDILVNNAGIAHVGNLEKTTEKDLDKIYEVNVKGFYNTMFAIVPHMKANGKGVILNIASITALVGIADRFAYSMSKGAVYAMTLSVAKDYLRDNIRCNSISPARIHTPFVDGFIKENYPGRELEMFEKLSKTQPIGRMGTVDEVAALSLFLCSDEAGFITGNDYPIDGGFLKLSS